MSLEMELTETSGSTEVPKVRGRSELVWGNNGARQMKKFIKRSDSARNIRRPRKSRTLEKMHSFTEGRILKPVRQIRQTIADISSTKAHQISTFKQGFFGFKEDYVEKGWMLYLLQTRKQRWPHCLSEYHIKIMWSSFKISVLQMLDVLYFDRLKNDTANHFHGIKSSLYKPLLIGLMAFLMVTFFLIAFGLCFQMELRKLWNWVCCQAGKSSDAKIQNLNDAAFKRWKDPQKADSRRLNMQFLERLFYAFLALSLCMINVPWVCLNDYGCKDLDTTDPGLASCYCADRDQMIHFFFIMYIIPALLMPFLVMPEYTVVVTMFFVAHFGLTYGNVASTSKLREASVNDGFLHVWIIAHVFGLYFYLTQKWSSEYESREKYGLLRQTGLDSSSAQASGLSSLPRGAGANANDSHLHDRGVVHIVGSCPDKGQYGDNVMSRVFRLASEHKFLHFGFDWAGGINKYDEDEELFEFAKKAEDVEQKRVHVVQTTWWKAYKAQLKGNIMAHIQSNEVKVVCIAGGPISQVERMEMKQILEDIYHDLKWNVEVKMNRSSGENESVVKIKKLHLEPEEFKDLNAFADWADQEAKERSSAGSNPAFPDPEGGANRAVSNPVSQSQSQWGESGNYAEAASQNDGAARKQSA